MMVKFKKEKLIPRQIFCKIGKYEKKKSEQNNDSKNNIDIDKLLRRMHEHWEVRGQLDPAN